MYDSSKCWFSPTPESCLSCNCQRFTGTRHFDLFLSSPIFTCFSPSHRGESGCSWVHAPKGSAWAWHPRRSRGNVQLLPPTWGWKRRGGIAIWTRRGSPLQQGSQPQRSAGFWLRLQRWRRRGTGRLRPCPVQTRERAARHRHSGDRRRGVRHRLHHDGGGCGLWLHLRLTDGQVPARAEEEAAADGRRRGGWGGPGGKTDIICGLKERRGRGGPVCWRVKAGRVEN